LVWTLFYKQLNRSLGPEEDSLEPAPVAKLEKHFPASASRKESLPAMGGFSLTYSG